MSSVAIIVAGPAGTGKTTVGQLIADHIKCPFIEGDSFHPPSNIDKMRNGIPLSDEDRWGWLKDIAIHVSAGGITVASCSALTEKYRDFLLQNCKGHYMHANMIESQLSIMQVPGKHELIENNGTCFPISVEHTTAKEAAELALEKLPSCALLGRYLRKDELVKLDSIAVASCVHIPRSKYHILKTDRSPVALSSKSNVSLAVETSRCLDDNKHFRSQS